MIPESNLVTCLSDIDMNDLGAPYKDQYQVGSNMVLQNGGDPVWYCPLDTEKNKIIGNFHCYGYSYFDVVEDFIDEDNLLLGIPTEHVPRPAQFVTVETEHTEQIVPEVDLTGFPFLDDEMIQVVPVCNMCSCSDTEEDVGLCRFAFDLSRPIDCPTFPEKDTFCSVSPPQSVSLDDEFLVPDIETCLFNQPSFSRFVEESEKNCFIDTSDFDREPDRDLSGTESEEFDRPVNSCSVQDQTVPHWAVEE